MIGKYLKIPERDYQLDIFSSRNKYTVLRSSDMLALKGVAASKLQIYNNFESKNEHGNCNECQGNSNT